MKIGLSKETEIFKGREEGCEEVSWMDQNTIILPFLSVSSILPPTDSEIHLAI